MTNQNPPPTSSSSSNDPSVISTEQTSAKDSSRNKGAGIRGWFQSATSPKNNVHDAYISETERSTTLRDGSSSPLTSTTIRSGSGSTGSRNANATANLHMMNTTIAEDQTSQSPTASWTSNISQLGRTVAQKWQSPKHSNNSRTPLQREWSEKNHNNLAGAASTRYLDGK